MCRYGGSWQNDLIATILNLKFGILVGYVSIITTPLGKVAWARPVVAARSSSAGTAAAAPAEHNMEYYIAEVVD